MSNGLKQDISIGKNLKELRRKANLTQAEVAARLEVMELPISANVLAKIEQGRYSIKISILLAMKQIYQLKSFDDFFTGL